MTSVNGCSCTCEPTPIGPSMADSCGGQFLLFMSILQSFIYKQCDLADPCNRVRNQDTLEDNYDFVVVGGGTAGSVLAARLSENPQWKVLLIEAGGHEPTPAKVPAFVSSYWNKNETDWLYKTEKQDKACLDEDGFCSWVRGKMLGGSSVVNGMMYMRGVPRDYDNWAEGGAKGWSWHEVLPYFLKSENNKDIGKGVSGEYHSRGGPWPVQRFRYVPAFAHDVVAASIEMGFPPTNDLNGAAITGFTIAQANNDGGQRSSTARAFLAPASERQNLHVLLNSHVSRVIIDPTEKKVTGVEYIKDGQYHTVGVTKEVVLAAGALNSPQILMLSGVGPKETLDKFNIPTLKDLPGVGQNLHNHIGVFLIFQLNKEAEVSELNWQTATEYLLNRNGPLSGTGLWQLTGRTSSKYADPDGQAPDLQFFFGGYGASCSDGQVLSDTEKNDIKKRRQVYISCVYLHPKSRGYVTLRSTDPQQAPIMQPNYFHDEHDAEVVMEAAKVAFGLANTTIMREKYGMLPLDGYDKDCGDNSDLSDEYLRCMVERHTAPENHQVGTCKMGPKSDVMAVVDPELKVHGIKGLRVADASIIPKVISGNTAAPIVMIAERGAEFMITSYQRSKNRPHFQSRFGDTPKENGHQNRGNTWDNGGFNNEAINNQANRKQNWDSNRWKPWDRNWHHAQWNNPEQYWKRTTQKNMGV